MVTTTHYSLLVSISHPCLHWFAQIKCEDVGVTANQLSVKTSRNVQCNATPQILAAFATVLPLQQEFRHTAGRKQCQVSRQAKDRGIRAPTNVYKSENGGNRHSREPRFYRELSEQARLGDSSAAEHP